MLLGPIYTALTRLRPSFQGNQWTTPKHGYAEPPHGGSIRHHSTGTAQIYKSSAWLVYGACMELHTCEQHGSMLRKLWLLQAADQLEPTNQGQPTLSHIVQTAAKLPITPPPTVTHPSLPGYGLGSRRSQPLEGAIDVHPQAQPLAAPPHLHQVNHSPPSIT